MRREPKAAGALGWCQLGRHHARLDAALAWRKLGRQRQPVLARLESPKRGAQQRLRCVHGAHCESLLCPAGPLAPPQAIDRLLARLAPAAAGQGNAEGEGECEAVNVSELLNGLTMDVIGSTVFGWVCAPRAGRLYPLICLGSAWGCSFT